MFASLFGHVAQHREDDKAGQKAGQTVDGARGQGISDITHTRHVSGQGNNFNGVTCIIHWQLLGPSDQLLMNDIEIFNSLTLHLLV